MATTFRFRSPVTPKRSTRKFDFMRTTTKSPTDQYWPASRRLRTTGTPTRALLFSAYFVSLIISTPPLPPPTSLIDGAPVEDLDGSADIQIEECDGGRPLPVSFLLQRAQERLHVDVRPPADPAAELQGQAALLAGVARNIRLPLGPTPAPTALCRA